MKYTKIVCTIGPASEKREILRDMVLNGMDVARLNFSHGTYAGHKKIMKTVREVSAEVGKTIGIMQDLQGPKIRIGDLKRPIKVKNGERIALGRGGLPVQYDLSRIVQTGQRILIDDGLIELKVTDIVPGIVHCEVVVGGTIISHKGVNVPESNTDFSVFTEKDRKDLEFGLKNNVDFVAMSFVRAAADILEVKNFIAKRKKKDQPWVIAKIEKSQAIKNLDQIIDAADGIMVARGDLAIEDEQEKVAVYQKIMIKKCLQKNKPVIVATQMLDSMMRNPRPTRAEVSDVSNAVLDHTDAVMLSGESAFGQYPRETVSTMEKIIEASENSYFDMVSLRKVFATDPILKQTMVLAKKHKTPIIIFSPLGSTALAVSNLRQELPLFVFTDSERVCQKLALIWGLEPLYLSNKAATFEKTKLESVLFQKLVDLKKIAPKSKAIFIWAKQSRGKEALVSAQLIKGL